MGRLHPHLEIYADDYGISEGVSEAILQSAVQGHLDAISVMTALWPERLKELNGIKLGLHWAPYKSMAPLIRQRLTGGVPRDKLRADFATQLRKFTEAIGRKPDYVDSHMHMHQVPGVREIFRACLTEHGLDCPRSTQGMRSPERTGALKRRILKRYGRGFDAQAQPILLTLDYERMQPQQMAEWVANELRAHKEPLQLIVHPGLAADRQLQEAGDGLWRHRDKDVRLLAELARRLQPPQ